jgi:hypothetical protein
MPPILLFCSKTCTKHPSGPEEAPQLLMTHPTLNEPHLHVMTLSGELPRTHKTRTAGSDDSLQCRGRDALVSHAWGLPLMQNYHPERDSCNPE